MPQSNLDFNARDNTKNVFRAIFNRLKNLTAKIFTMRAAMSAFGIFMAGRFVNQTLKFNDVIGKVSDSVKVTTEFLQKLRFANEQGGVSIQETDRALQKFSRSMGDLRAGTGSLFSIFKDTDTAFLKLLQSTKSNEEAFLAFTANLGRYKRAQDQATVASAAFGRVGVKMVTTFKDGNENFRKLSSEAERFGLILDDKVVRNSEKTNDSLNLMSKSIRVVFAKSIDRGSEAIGRFSRFILENRKTIEGFIDSIFNAGSKIKTVFDSVNILLRKARVEALVLTGQFKSLSKEDLPKINIELENAVQKLEKMKTGSISSTPLGILTQTNKVVEFTKRVRELEREDAIHKHKLKIAQQIFDVSMRLQAEREHKTKLLKTKELNSKEVQLEKDRIDNQLRARIQGIELSSATEIERLAIALDRRIAILEQSFERRLINKTKFDDLRLKLEEQYQDKLNEIIRSGNIKRRDLDNMSNAQKFASTVSMFKKLTSAGTQHSKALFNMNKIAAIADTIISTRTAAMKAYKDWGWPLGAVFAGLIVAAGAANISAIKSQSFSGGGSVSGGAGAGAGGISSPSDLGATTEVPRGPRQIILALPDDTEVVSKNWIRNSLLPAINDELGDGGEFVA